MKYLKTMRRKNSLTQNEMANLIDVSYSHYVKLENGFVKPSFELLKRIKEKFSEVDMNEFFK